ncbi:MAG: 2-amino-4-hydroxy-6-hydroxymethyldihydropteridine diphosphokinase [Oscillospiraceae bacterium]|jgi:2-amino-4-hydroxy-6-hydroxymethyldihydropteridine diphosphokinase|nr:2-amino-4-hydroxy-6-hydroxymethyldihydropteridine diphosphokinase [Oscillospiraceae bacterium]
MSEAVIGLGSNLGDRNAHLLEAVQALSRLTDVKIKAISSIYASEPEGAPAGETQSLYHNMAVMLETKMSPMALLGACLGIEAAMGRLRGARNAARIIDLDLLLYEGVKSENFELSLPHPRLLQRAFVLLPLKELYPAGRAPGIFFEPCLKAMDIGSITRLEQRISMEK